MKVFKLVNVKPSITVSNNNKKKDFPEILNVPPKRSIIGIGIIGSKTIIEIVKNAIEGTMAETMKLLPNLPR